MRMLACLLGLSLLITACDEDDASDGEQPGIDAAPDGGGGDDPADAGPPTLTVLAFHEYSGNAFEGATVLVLDESGAVTATAATDATGSAVVATRPGDSVVVLREDSDKGAFYNSIHFHGVQAGDVLRAGRPLPSPGKDQLLEVTGVDVEGISEYEVQTGCGDRSTTSTFVETTLPIFLTRSCHGDRPTSPVLVLAGPAYDPVAYVSRAAHDLSGPLGFDAWATDFVDFVGTLSGQPDLESVELKLLLFGAGGEDFELTPVATPTVGGIPLQVGTWKVPPDLASSWVFDVHLRGGKLSTGRHSAVLAAWPVDDVTLDYPGDFLPLVEEVSLGKGTGADTEVGFTVDAESGGLAADAVQFELGFGGRVTWILVYPGEVTSGALPELPGEYAAFLPGEKQRLEYVRVALVDTDEDGGYALVRGILGTYLDDDLISNLRDVTDLIGGESFEVFVRSSVRSSFSSI